MSAPNERAGTSRDFDLTKDTLESFTHRIKGRGYRRPCPKHGSASEKKEDREQNQATVQDNVSSQPSDTTTTSDPGGQRTPPCILLRSVEHRTEGSKVKKIVTDTWCRVVEEEDNGQDHDQGPLMRVCSASQQYELDDSTTSQQLDDSTTSDSDEETSPGSPDDQAKPLNHRTKRQRRGIQCPVHGSTSQKKEESGQNENPVQDNASSQALAGLSAPSQSASSSVEMKCGKGTTE